MIKKEEHDKTMRKEFKIFMFCHFFYLFKKLAISTGVKLLFLFFFILEKKKASRF
jgi:hypothetical protein